MVVLFEAAVGEKCFQTFLRLRFIWKLFGGKLRGWCEQRGHIESAGKAANPNRHCVPNNSATQSRLLVMRIFEPQFGTFALSIAILAQESLGLKVEAAVEFRLANFVPRMWSLALFSLAMLRTFLHVQGACEARAGWHC
eukprot:1492708-Amphidinium_carterae.1